jgi:chromosome segregation ATPase
LHHQEAQGQLLAQADLERLRQLRAALVAVADSLTAQAATLDAAAVKKLGQGLGAAADYLEKELSPAAESAARQLEETSEALRVDSARLAELLRAAPLDMDVVQQVHEAMGRFAAGTDALSRVLELPRLGEIRKGLQGLGSSLDAGAHQVDDLGLYYYPVVTFEGWRPKIKERLFWPGAATVAAGMYDAGAGVKAAEKELATLGAQLPKVRAGLDSSRHILERSRDTLGTVLKYRHLIEPLVKNLPETAARLAEDLPKLTQQLAATLRDTQKMKAIAAGLRAGQEQLDQSVAAWPEARLALLQTAAALRASGEQLDKAMALQTPGEAARMQLAGVQDVNPVLADRPTLANLGEGLRQVAEVQVMQAAAFGQFMRIARWALWLCALLLAGHGVYHLVRPNDTARSQS